MKFCESIIIFVFTYSKYLLILGKLRVENNFLRRKELLIVGTIRWQKLINIYI